MVVLSQKVRTTLREDPLVNNLFITDIGYYPNAKHHYRNRENGASEYILIYCVDGHGWIDLKSEYCEITPNSYFIIPAQTAHRYGARQKKPWSIYWIHFNGNVAAHFYHKFAFSKSSRQKQQEVRQIPFEEQRIEDFNGIITLLEKGYSREIIEYVNVSVWQLIGSFIYNGYYSNTRHQNNESNIIDEAIGYMKKNLSKSLTVEEIADQLNYSTSYLYSLFKKETGYSPIYYYNQLKIRKACQYLSFTSMNVKVISYELDFNDPFYFSRLFKKIMNLAPTDYKKIFNVILARSLIKRH